MTLGEFGILAGFLLLIVGLVSAVVAAIQYNDAQFAKFQNRCTAAHGKVLQTRDVDMCLNGNVILFRSN